MDAVRFCNVLSRKAGLDTVYSYTSMALGSNELVQSIQGLGADLGMNGYRLPTEAEWTFAARGSTQNIYPWGNDTAQATVSANTWYAQNSSSQLHPTSQKSPDNGVYDLAGNAMELVWGWYGPLPGDTVNDYAGLRDMGSAGQVVVKGGSFANGLASMRVSARADVYPVTYATRTSYIGFRVARGSVASPSFSNESGKALKGTAIHVVATRDQLRAFFGTALVKLAMVNGTNGKLSTIDLSISTPYVSEATDTNACAHPSISPNGFKVAFSNKAEGQIGISSLFLINFGDSIAFRLPAASGAVPHWWVANADTVLVYAQNAQSNQDSIVWASQSTLRALPFGTEQVVADNGAFHSGISDNGQFLATGYTSLRVENRLSGAVHTYFQSPQNGKDASGSTQVCNVSVRPGTSPDLLFLDFGYGGQSKITGNSYDIHGVLFLADITNGNVTGHFSPPQGYSAWDYPRWSNYPHFAVASVADAKGNHRAVYAIKIPEGDTLKLLAGDDILMPNLWVDHVLAASPIGQLEDSLGRYDIPSTQLSPSYNEAMNDMWNGIDSFDAYVFGSSRELNGVISDRIQGFTTMNMAEPAEPPYAGIQLTQDYLLARTRKPKVILLGLGPDFSSVSTFTWFNQNTGSSVGYAFDQKHHFWSSGMPDSLNFLRQRIFLDRAPYRYFDSAWGGHVEPACNGWGTPLLDLDVTWARGQAGWYQGFLNIENFVQQVNQLGIKVAALVLPMNPAYATTSYYSRHGGLRADVDEFLDSVKSLENGNSNFRLLDFNHDGLHDFVDSEANNSDHLCTVGASRLTDSISARIQDWR